MLQERLFAAAEIGKEDRMATPTQIEIPGTNALIRTAPAPLEILQSAIDKNMNPETLKQLMDLQERWEANEAKKDFIEAMGVFKANAPTIRKNKDVSFGNTHFSHATLDHACEMIVPALSAVGISHRWKTQQIDGRIQVTCVLTHKRGHSEETTLDGAPDSSGSKNSIQAIGSAVTYLQRYTLLAATGLAAEDQDDDGATAGPKMDDIAEKVEFLANASHTGELKEMFEQYSKEAKQIGDKAALLRLIAAKDKRKKELQ